MAELAGLVGKMVELSIPSQPNPLSDHQPHPVLKGMVESHCITRHDLPLLPLRRIHSVVGAFIDHTALSPPLPLLLRLAALSTVRDSFSDGEREPL